MTRWFPRVVLAVLLLAATRAGAIPVSNARTIRGVDVVSAGVGGLGAGTGTIVLGGVSGRVINAFLYWHGIDAINDGGDGIYDNATVSFAGNSVTGSSLGDSSTNCWGPGASRAFRADVTSLVPGNGSYTIGGLAAAQGHSGNGASLVVVFDDGNPANNRDLVFFEGNDSNDPEDFPGEDDGWHATLANVGYSGGKVFAELHVADGQSLEDGDLVFSSGSGSTTIPDDPTRYDGVSVPDNGTGRTSDGALWDIHRFDVTLAFASSGSTTLAVDGLAGANDCLGLVALILDLEAGAAPCGNGTIDPGEACDPAAVPTGCSEGSCIQNCTCGCSTDDQCDDLDACTTDVCTAGVCSHSPVTPLPSTCATTPPPMQPDLCAGKDCSDGNPCTDDVCDPASGSCSNPPTQAGAACDDGNACTDTSTCQAGQCVSGPAACSVDVTAPPPGQPVKAVVQTAPGGLCDSVLIELVPTGQTAAVAHANSVPAGFQTGRQFSRVVRKRAKKRGKQAGRVVIRLKLNRAGTSALKQSSAGELPVLARFTITQPGGLQRIVDQLLTVHRRNPKGAAKTVLRMESP